MAHRLGRTVLLTNRLDWTAEQVIDAYTGQQRIEQVFRGLKDGDWLGWGPMHHCTDSKIRIHAFYCMLGVSLLQSLHRNRNRLARPLCRTSAGRTRPDQAIRAALPGPRREGSASHRHRAF